MSNEILDIELSRQLLFTQELRDFMVARTKGKAPLAHVKTYGCQQNVADGEKIKGILSEIGFSFTENRDEADFIIFNTCAVREHAEDRVFGNIGALKNLKLEKPSLIIAVCGCMMEQEHVAERIKKSYPFVNIVFGTHVIHKLPEFIHSTVVDLKRVFMRGGETNEIVEGLPIRRDGKAKAYVTIMYGCDNFCSYCVVPYVRGREKSRKSADIINEVKLLVAQGFKEIYLLGQNVNSYGKGTDISFAKLLQRLDELEGDFQLRFMTSHPKDATKELFLVMANSKHICHHIHLPFQSGNNRVLKEMNRKYTREHYLGLMAMAKEIVPDITFTSDIIVGFPGESYEEFLDTISLVKQAEFVSLYTFIFSKRKGTKAQDMDDPVEYKEKSAWFTELLKVQGEISANRTSKMVGSSCKVLTEERNPKNGLLSGRNQSSIIVQFEGGDELIGEFVNVKITKAKNLILQGTIN